MSVSKRNPKSGRVGLNLDVCVSHVTWVCLIGWARDIESGRWADVIGHTLGLTSRVGRVPPGRRLASRGRHVPLGRRLASRGKHVPTGRRLTGRGRHVPPGRRLAGRVGRVPTGRRLANRGSQHRAMNLHMHPCVRVGNGDGLLHRSTKNATRLGARGRPGME